MRDDSHPVISGSISLWRYRENVRNYPGWHLSADRRGGESLHALLLALRSTSGHRTVPITRPTAEVLSVPNNKNGTAKWIAVDKWRIEYAEANHWAFTQKGELALLTIGTEDMADLIAGVATMQADGDYSIGEGESGQRLWLWWRPNLG